jgi:hypothetical protein
MFEKNTAEDIFEGTDASAPSSPPQPPPVANVPAPVERAAVMSSIPEAPRGGHGGLKTLVILLLAFGAIAVAAYLTYVFMAKAPTGDIDGVQGEGEKETVIEEEGKGEEPETEGNNELTTEPEEADPQDRSSLMDSDGDGLTNAEELEVGTAVSMRDTDSDGLGDREEVRVYGTDPRRTDTDDDGFLDGEEVAGGYNPNGPGKLLEVPKSTTP